MKQTVTSAARRALDRFCILAALILGSNAGAAVIIDDFVSGPYSGYGIIQNGLDPSTVLGGSRFVNGGPMSIDTVQGQYQFNSGSDFGYFTVGWGVFTPLNADLTLGGNDRFLINVANLTPGLYRGLFDFKVRTSPGADWQRVEFFSDLAAIPGHGTVVIPFSRFAGSLTNVQRIELDVARFEPNSVIAIDSIIAVPEPSAAILFTAGLSYLFLRLRSRDRLLF